MFNSIFSMDGPFYKYGTLVFDLFVLNILWALFGGPLIIFTLWGLGFWGLFVNMPIVAIILMIVILFNMGASTTAVFYVTNRKVREKDGYMFRDFWKSFKTNYKQATIIWVLIMAVFVILYIDITNIKIFGSMASIVLPIQFFIAIEFLFIAMYSFPVLARFHIKTKNLFKTAFFMANRHLLTTIVCVVIPIALGFLIIKVHPVFFLFLFSGYAMLSSYMFERVFKKYIPEEEYDDYATEDMMMDSVGDNYDFEAEQMMFADKLREKGNTKSIESTEQDNTKQDK